MFFCRFVYFCSAIFVLLFLFCYFCSAIFVPLFLFCWGLFALKPHLPHYLMDNFCSADLFALALTNFCSATFVTLFLFCWGLFALKPIFVPLFLFSYFCSTGAFLHLNLNQFLFCYFCPAIFVLLGPFFVPLFLFRYFCSTDLFALAFTNFCSTGAFFCSASFVPLVLFH